MYSFSQRHLAECFKVLLSKQPTGILGIVTTVTDQRTGAFFDRRRIVVVEMGSKLQSWDLANCNGARATTCGMEVLFRRNKLLGNRLTAWSSAGAIAAIKTLYRKLLRDESS